MCSVARGKTWAGRMLTSGLVGVEGGLVGVGDLGRRLVLETGRDEHPVLAAIEALVAQVPDVGDVLDVEHVDAVVQQRPPDEVGQQVCCAGCRRGRSDRRSGRRCTSRPVRRRGARPARPAGSGCCAGAGSSGPNRYASRDDLRDRGPNVSGRRARYRTQRPRGPDSIVPPAVWACEASSHARRVGPPGGPSEGLRPTRPILPAMRRLIAFVVLATLFASCGGSAAAARTVPCGSCPASRPRSTRPPRATPAARRSRPSCSSR